MAENTHLGAFSKYGCNLLSSQPEGRVQGWPLGIYDKESERWKWQPTPWGHKESDTTERLHFTPLSSSFITGEGNGSPLQYSCLENPMDRGSWRAMVHGVAEGRTRLK